MNRLTIDKPVSEMGMYELALNSCYVAKDGTARYRDFEHDIDARDLARNLMIMYKLWGVPDKELTDDDAFDDTMIDNLSAYLVEPTGLIALFYRNLWAMAELRERLKQYEDLSEQGLLLRLPCKNGTIVYRLVPKTYKKIQQQIVSNYVFHDNALYYESMKSSLLFPCSEIGKTVFLTKAEAEKALAEMG